MCGCSESDHLAIMFQVITKSQCRIISAMSVISLTSKTKLVEVPKRKIVLDSRLDRPVEQIEEATIIRDQLCVLGNDVDTGIRSRTDNTVEKIKYLGEVQEASVKYWTIVGSTIAALIGINAVVGGWKFWKWLKQRRKNDPRPVRVNEVGDVESFNGRIHARDWKLSEQMIVEE